MTRRLALILGLAALSLAGAGCGPAHADAAPSDAADRGVSVRLEPTRLQPVERSVQVAGTIFGDEETTISATVPGRVTSLAVDVGDRAAAGAVLAQIDTTAYELAVAQGRMGLLRSLAPLGLEALPGADFDPAAVPAVEQARLQAVNAKAKYERARALFETPPSLMSEQAFADLRTASEVAQRAYQVELLTVRSLLAEAATRSAELDIARQRLADTAVRAPGSAAPGPRYAVAQRLVSPGEYVREGTAMFRLIADDPVKLRAEAPERFIAGVRAGQAVDVRVDAWADAFPGRVSRIAPQVDPASRTFAVEIIIANADGRLRPGSFARGRVRTGVDEDVTFVPQEAIVSALGAHKVFTVEDGLAVEHTVETGAREGGFVEIVQGLAGQAMVVVSGNTRLAQGTPVNVRPAP